MKNFLLYSFLLLIGLVAYGQRAYVNSIDKRSGEIADIVTISGNGFSTTSSDLTVFFGGVTGSITSSTANLIEVKVPSGSIYDEVFVVNKSSRTSSASAKFFQSNYGGESFDGLTNSEIDALFDLQDISTGQNLVYDVCSCDLDGDGLNDIMVSAQQDGSSRARRLIYRNTSDTSNTSFTLAAQLGAQPSSHIQCKDLNMDGKPDVVFSEIEVVAEGDTGFPEIEVWTNNSTSGSISLSLAFTEDYLVPQRDKDGKIRNPTRLELEDVDDDGLPDIIMSNISDEKIDIFLNKSANGTMDFETTSQQVSITAGLGFARGIELGDLNNDLLVDLVIIPFEGDVVSILQNESIDGSVQFREPVEIEVAGKLFRNADIGDYDGDGFNDIAVTNDNGTGQGSVLTFRNTTGTAGALFSYALGPEVLLGVSPWGISSGDVDGDGDVDIAVAMSDSDATSMYLMANTSSSGSISFNAKTITTNNNARNVEIADFNGDAKPDIALTTKSLSNTAGNLTILTNRNCATPVITPGSDLYCNGITFDLQATKGLGLTYDWKINAGSVQNSSDSTYDISAQTGTLAVTVTTTSADGKCTRTSAEQTYTENTNTPPTPSISTSSNPVCSNENLTLSAGVTADNYQWTGPGDFTSTEASPTITAASVSAGTYAVKVFNNNGCKSTESSTAVTVIATPFPKVFNNDPDEFCVGGSAGLFSSSYSGYGYQWNLNGTAISGQTTTSLTADASGDYSFTIIDQTNDCQSTSVGYSLLEANPPQPTIEADTALCIDLQLDVAGDTASGLTDYGLTYSWNFTNASNTSVHTDNQQNTDFTFTTAGQYTLSLTTAYVDIANCSANTTQNVTIQAVPDYNITSSFPDLIKCYEDTVTLSVQSDLVSYGWVTLDSTYFEDPNDLSDDPDTLSSVLLFTPNEEDFVDVTVTMVDQVGCVIEDSTRIRNYTDANISISSPDPNTPITDAQLLIPEDYLSLQLQADEGTEFSWSPGSIFDDSTATNVTVYPNAGQIEVVLTGLDNNGCLSEYRIDIIQPDRVARKSFSPNNDGLGFDCWEIVNANEFTDCTIYIFDQRGRVIFEENTPFDTDCIWNGVSQGGLAAPPGVYYYVLKCENSEENLKGTILLAR